MYNVMIYKFRSSIFEMPVMYLLFLLTICLHIPDSPNAHPKIKETKCKPCLNINLLHLFIPRHSAMLILDVN